jgi:hypothetical protein
MMNDAVEFFSDRVLLAAETEHPQKYRVAEGRGAGAIDAIDAVDGIIQQEAEIGFTFVAAPFGNDAAGHIDGDRQDAAGPAVIVPDRVEAIGPEGFGIPAEAPQHEAFAFTAEPLAGYDHALKCRGKIGPYLRPYAPGWLAQHRRMPIGQERRPGIVVDQSKIRAPINCHGRAGSQA